MLHLKERGVRFVLATDLDHTLVRLLAWVVKVRRCGLVRIWQKCFLHDSMLIYSTGRSPAKYGSLRNSVPLLAPDVLVCSVGTEIFWKQGNGVFVPDEKWGELLDRGWELDRIRSIAVSLVPHHLTLQEESEQRPHKISFHLHSKASEQPASETVEQIRRALAESGIPGRVVFSGGQHLDILPLSAGKGNALTYLLNELRELNCYPTDGFQVNGDSGNDIDLFKVEGSRGCIVSNAMPELLQWADRNKDSHTVFKATKPCASGIVEALEHYGTMQSSPTDLVLSALLGAMEELGRNGDDSFLSDSFLVQTDGEQILIGRDLPRLRKVVQMDSNSFCFLDAIHPVMADNQIQFHMCQIQNRSEGATRRCLPVEVHFRRDSETQVTWTALRTNAGDRGTDYGAIA